MTTQHKEGSTLRIPGYRKIQDAQLIIRLEGNGNYTIIHLKGQLKPLLVSQTLKYFEFQLPDFIRVSKSSIINPAYIKKVIQEDPKTMSLELADGVIILVSRRRVTGTLSRLGS